MSIERKTAADAISKSADIVADNIDKLKQLFPSIFTEGNIDFEALKEILGDKVETDPEYYRFTWPGKAMAKEEARKPSRGTLRPAKEESVNWDTTENLYIEGDNLEVLKLLQKSYANKVKMIYIDPPYNTGKDFVYKDNYKDNLASYNEKFNRTDEDGNLKSSASETNQEGSARYHSNWLNMMYPRLVLARNLLTEDGVIFISIDEVEYSNLRNICNTTLGENNHIADFVWQNKKGGGNDSKYVAVEHEYVLMYAKNEVNLHNLFEPYKPEYLKRYKEEDKIGKFFWDTFKRKSGKQFYKIECPDGSVLDKDENGNPISWLRSESRFEDDLKKGEVRFVKYDDNWSIHFKQRLPQGKKPRTIFLEDSIWNNVATNSNASKEILDLFGKEVFSNPKPIGLMKKILSFSLQENDIVLDFFSGSGTIFQACFESSNELKKNIKCIAVQLPAKINDSTVEGKNALSLGFDKITTLAQERIRLAGKKILEENPKLKDKLDVGFKVFKLDESNIKTWETDPEKLDENLFLENVIKSDRNEEDVLYEILLKYGLDLTLPIQEKKIGDHNLYAIGGGALLVYLGDNANIEIAQHIINWAKELDAINPQVVFKDNGFNNSQDKVNTLQVLKSKNITDVWSI